MNELSPVERVKAFVTANGVETRVVELDRSTRTSALAAAALGCTIGEIAKSIVFTGETTAVVVISGDRRVDPAKLGSLVGGSSRVATPGEVAEITGYVIGGVPPFPHREGVRLVADSSMSRFERVWAASGTANSVMQLRVSDILRFAGDRAYDVAMA